MTGVLGSIATWILSRKTPKLPTQSPRSSTGQALSANSGAVASTPETPVEEVPIGIAWKELREEQAEEKRGNTGQGTPTGVSSDREVGQPMSPHKSAQPMHHCLGYAPP